MATQEQVNQLNTGPEFNVVVVQSQVMTIIFLTLFFSSTMPLLYPLCFLFLVVMFYFSKFMILKICQRPTTYNERLIMYSYETIKWAVLIHMILSLVMFGNSTMLFNQTSTSNFDNQIYELPDIASLLENLKSGKTPYFGLLVIFSVVTLAIVVIVFYTFNLLSCNPVSVCKCLKHKRIE